MATIEPPFPKGTPEYAAYEAELKVELAKFAKGEAPYEIHVDLAQRAEEIADEVSSGRYIGGHGGIQPSTRKIARAVALQAARVALGLPKIEPYVHPDTRPKEAPVTAESAPHDFESNDEPDAQRRGKPTCIVCGHTEANIEGAHL